MEMILEKPKLIQVEYGIEGKIYKAMRNVFPNDQPLVILWKKAITREVYVFVPQINKLVVLPHGYVLEETNEFHAKPNQFDEDMQAKYFIDFPGRLKFWQNKIPTMVLPKVVPIVVKETEKMSDSPEAPAKTVSKKEVRATFNAEILQYKEQREALSNANKELKKQVQALKTRAERAPLNLQVKANVDERARLSDAIKANVEKVKALRSA